MAEVITLGLLAGQQRRMLEEMGKSVGEAKPLKATDADAVVIMVHSLAHVIGALKASARARRPIILSSAPEAGVYAGPGWFCAVVAAAREAVPDARFSAILDCGDHAGAALAAIRAQIEGVIFTGGAGVASRLADIACQHGVHLQTTRPTAALDLGSDFFASAEIIEHRCADVLA